MSTLIRPELSETNRYWIEKHRYYELKHFCLQYPLWRHAYNSLIDYPGSWPQLVPPCKTNVVIIYTGMPLCLSHSAESKDDPEDEEKKKDSKEDKSAENKEEKKDNEETIADVIDSMSEKQQNVMYALIAQALEGEPEKESKDDSDNKSESNKEDINIFRTMVQSSAQSIHRVEHWLRLFQMTF